MRLGGVATPKSVRGRLQGEVLTKDSFTQANYKWCDNNVNLPTKYTIDPEYSEESGVPILPILEPQDDAANVLLGNTWRIPTRDEWEEIMDDAKTLWESTSMNGIRGIKITSKINHNIIFLPFGKGRSDDAQYDDGMLNNYDGAYWSSCVEYDHSAAFTVLISSYPMINYHDKDGSYNSHEKESYYEREAIFRHYGLFIRPVKD